VPSRNGIIGDTAWEGFPGAVTMVY